MVINKLFLVSVFILFAVDLFSQSPSIWGCEFCVVNSHKQVKRVNNKSYKIIPLHLTSDKKVIFEIISCRTQGDSVLLKYVVLDGQCSFWGLRNDYYENRVTDCQMKRQAFSLFVVEKNKKSTRFKKNRGSAVSLYVNEPTLCKVRHGSSFSFVIEVEDFAPRYIEIICPPAGSSL